MYPSRSEAESLLYEAETCNPGETTAAQQPTVPPALPANADWTRRRHMWWGFCTILDGVLANDIWAMWWTGLSI